MSEKTKERAIILHGIGMNRLRMTYLHFALHQAGFDVLNIGYPSLKMSIEECATNVAAQVAKRDDPTLQKTHIVGHSMGCLVALEIMQHKLIRNISRALFIAPPYRGSEVADRLAQTYLYRRFFGPAGQQLTTAHHRQNIYKISSGIEIGVIAGTRAYEYPLFLSIMKKTGVHDGLVSVESTRIPEAKDHITIRASHSFLLEASTSQTVHFLRHGTFKRIPLQ